MAKKKRTRTPRGRAAATSHLRLLDISTSDFDRPTVKIDGEPYLMRVAEELTFDEFARQISIGNRIEVLSDTASDEESLHELGELMAESVRVLLIDVPEDVIAKLSPGLIGKILTFFKVLAADDIEPAPASENGSKT